MSETLRRVQEELVPWQAHNFPGRTYDKPFKGTVEELGELTESLLAAVVVEGRLAHALLKQEQNIRGTRETHEAKAMDAVGDLVIFLADLCNARGWDLDAIVRTTWESVKQRDWQKHRQEASLVKD